MYNDPEADMEGPGKHRVYRTGWGGHPQAVLLIGLGAVFPGFLIFMVAKLLWLRPADIPVDSTPLELIVIFGVTLMLTLAFLIPGIRLLLEVRNSKVMVSDSGMTIANWRKAKKLVLWENVVGVVQTYYLTPFNE